MATAFTFPGPIAMIAGRKQSPTTNTNNTSDMLYMIISFPKLQ